MEPSDETVELPVRCPMPFPWLSMVTTLRTRFPPMLRTHTMWALALQNPLLAAAFTASCRHHTQLSGRQVSTGPTKWRPALR